MGLVMILMNIIFFDVVQSNVSTFVESEISQWTNISKWPMSAFTKSYVSKWHPKCKTAHGCSCKRIQKVCCRASALQLQGIIQPMKFGRASWMTVGNSLQRLLKYPSLFQLQISVRLNLLHTVQPKKTYHNRLNIKPDVRL